MLDPQNDVRLFRLQEAQVGIDQRVDENDQCGTFDQVTRHRDGVRLAVAFGLQDVICLHTWVMFLHERFNLITQVSGNEDEFLLVGVTCRLQDIENMSQDRLSCGRYQWLGLAPGLRAQAGTIPGHGDDDLQ